ncbi:MAG: HD domain-containing protein [Clostridiales bacterium]|nr:HD domain-containing protein [Clostridiales bacterium]MCD8154760.1 HD domain-containing protein [Clostridiales bacterium]
MRFISELREGDRISGIYLCKQKQSAVTKNGKPYENITLQDKTGLLDGKIWDPNSIGIEDFEALDYIDVMGDVSTFAGALQINIKRVRRAREGEYDPADYLPVSSRDREEMYRELLGLMDSVTNPFLHTLLQKLFVEDSGFVAAFKAHSAAKTVHHGFVGGLLEHTLSVTRLCEYMAGAYPVLNRNLLISAALLHDVGKTRELAAFPVNDYTDEGQLLGHIIIGAQMVHDLAGRIPDFPRNLENQLVHCILAHHGELEYGSPKKPALAEAVALNLADNTDARMETLTEIFAADKSKKDWLGYNRLFESNLRRTEEDR